MKARRVVLVAVLLVCRFSGAAFAADLVHTTTTLSQARSRIAATTVGNLAIFAGGLMGSGSFSPRVDIYNASTGEWTHGDWLSQGRCQLGATSVGDLAIFAGGLSGPGSFSPRVDIYNATTGEWRSGDWLSQGRYALGATTVGSLAFFAGGNSGCGSYRRRVDVYDAATGEWTFGDWLSQARDDMGVTALGDVAFFAGGATSCAGTDTAIVDKYHADRGSPAEPSAWSTHALSQARYALEATTVGNRAIFAGGRRHGGPASSVVDMYDADLGGPNDPDAWSTHSLSQARYALAHATLDNLALFAGGCDTNDVASGVVDCYEAGTNTWQVLEPLSQARHHLSGTAVCGHVAIFAGGKHGGVFSDVVDIYAIAPREVMIDIKPGSDPNSINLGSNGGVPVAIFSTDCFDATTIDPFTVTLAGASVRLRGRGTPMASSEDVDGDGLLDLVLHVETEVLELTEGDTEAWLTGATLEGIDIQGMDFVRVVPQAKLPEPAFAVLLIAGLGLVLRRRTNR